MRKKSILLGIILFGLSFMASATVIDTTLCKGKSITLTPRGDYAGSTLEWFQGGVSVSTNPYYTVTPNVSTVYELHVDGSATETFNVNVVNVAPTTMYDTACDSYRWIDGITYMSSTTTPSVVFRSVQGCDSMVTLNLTVYNKHIDGSESADVCDEYTWKNQTYYTSGTYEFDTLTTQGCDSTVTLYLTVRHRSSGDTTAVACDAFTWYGTACPATGSYQRLLAGDNAQNCDSTVTLHLTLRHSSTPVVYPATACDLYVWPLNNETYTASSNTAVAHLTNKAGCDSTVTLDLTVYNKHLDGAESADVCDEYTWKNQTYYTSGTYEFDTLTTQGCDSTVTLYLTVRHRSSGDTTAVACDAFTWYGTACPATGSYQRLLAGDNAQNCDSTVTLHLTIRQSSIPVVYPATACDSYVWPLNNETYTASNNTAVAHLTNKAGCDSIVTLNLTVYNKHIDGAESADVCDEYTWKNQTYYTSGTYEFDTLTTQGCDSTVTLYLTVRHRSSGDTTAVACDAFTWYGTACPATGSYQRLLAGGNAQNCDSTITLHLTLNHSSSSVNIPQTACDNFTWNGVTYNTSGNYTQLFYNAQGCDSTVNLNLTIHLSTSSQITQSECDSLTAPWETTYYATGLYTYHYNTTHGCDSLVTLNLTVRHSTANTEVANVCDSYTWHGNTYTTTPGTYPRDTTTNTQGCDSVVTLNLTVRHRSVDTNIDTTVCDGFFIWDTRFTTTGNYQRTLINTVGCDSTINLDLTVKYKNTGDTSAEKCDRFDWYEYTDITSNGDYQHLFPDANQWGCDSTVTLHLTIKYKNTGDTTAIACDTFSWYEHVDRTVSGDYQHHFSGANQWGCDSTVTLHLTVNYKNTGDTTAVECDGFSWYEYSGITSSGDYQHLFADSNQWRCDSTVTLHLTIKKSVHTAEYDTACTSYTWHNKPPYEQSGTYIDSVASGPCMNTDTLHLHIYGKNRPEKKSLVVKGGTSPWAVIYPRAAGEQEHLYQWYKGDEPIEGATKQFYALPSENAGTTVLYKVWVSDINVLECGSYSETNVNYGGAASKSLRITPNPSNGHFEVAVEGDNLHAIRTEVYTLQGVCLMSIPMDGNYISVDSSLPQGSYLLRVVTEEGDAVSEKLIVR